MNLNYLNGVSTSTKKYLQISIHIFIYIKYLIVAFDMSGWWVIKVYYVCIPFINVIEYVECVYWWMIQFNELTIVCIIYICNFFLFKKKNVFYLLCPIHAWWCLSIGSDLYNSNTYIHNRIMIKNIYFIHLSEMIYYVLLCVDRIKWYLNIFWDIYKYDWIRRWFKWWNT